jgi:hypothetical protein
MFNTYVFERNSQTPSLAITTNLSFSVSVISVTSGSGITPTEWATLSPIDLDIAKPGMSSYLTHTHLGPNSSPL